MDFLFLLNGFLCLAFFVFFIANYFHHINDPRKKKAINSLFWIVIFYFLFFILFILWFFNFFNYSLGDFLTIWALGLVIQTVLFLRIGYLFSKNNLFLFLIGGYSIFVVLLFFDFTLFLKYSPFLSYVAMSFFFLQFLFMSSKYKVLGIAGLFYSVVSVILSILFIAGINVPVLFFFFSTAVLFGFVILFFRDLEKFEFLEQEYEEKPAYLIFLRNLVFIILLINFVFIGTIVIHEFGHYGVSQFYDCEFRKIVYEGDFFHTEIFCSNIEDKMPVVLGGIILPLLVALVAIFVGGRFLKEIGILMIGFNFISVSRDLGELGLSENFIFACIFLAGVFLIWGIVLFIKSKVDISLH